MKTLGQNASEAKRNICRANGKRAVSTKTACRWFERFRNGDFLLEDEPRSGHPTEIDLSELKDVIERDLPLTLQDIASKFGCTHRAILYQFKQLRLVSNLGQWVPHDLIRKKPKKTQSAFVLT